ncbi:MAG TPA: rhodanese-like domain-containing protein [Alphaproteobacteria bacterium]|nr:rhodanese-like domain-containing protein [Alphaproteobacteria bacterium]
MKVGYKELLAEADRAVEAVTVEQAAAMRGKPDVVFVDIRDIRELNREGTIEGAMHAPRGMLEFWVDPESPYHKPVFSSGKRFVLFCASGWRSALATLALQRMGLAPICHLKGGLTAWKNAGLPVAAVAMAEKSQAREEPKP